MIYGAISEKDEQYYTYMDRVFDSINNVQKEYNWLITDCDCHSMSGKPERMFCKEYCWISGEELTEIVNSEKFQWVWGVLSAFDKTVELDEVLKYELPYADGYGGFWKNPITMQHPLSKIEIVPWDSSLTLIFSKDEKVINDFRAYYHKSENLEEFINRYT